MRDRFELFAVGDDPVPDQRGGERAFGFRRQNPGFDMVQHHRHALLVDDDGRRDVGKGIGVGLAVMGHELLDESGIGLVDQPLGFGSDGAKNQRGFSRARNAGKDCDLAFGDIDGAVKAKLEATICEIFDLN